MTGNKSKDKIEPRLSVIVPLNNNNLKVINWLPVAINAFFQENFAACVDDNTRSYLALLPGSRDDELVEIQVMGVYHKPLVLGSDENGTAETIKLNSVAEGSDPANTGNVYNATKTSGLNSTSPLGQLTTNATDAIVTLAEPIRPFSLDNMYSSNNAGAGQDLSTFLSRPHLFRTGSFASTDAASTFAPIKLFSDLMSLDVYKSKIKGFLGFKATTVVTLQINATRFQQGRYFLAFLPTGGVSLSSTAGDRFKKQHMFSLKQWTMLPHVEIDVACDTQAQLRIPFVSAETYWPLNATTGNCCGDIGAVMIRPYIPVVSASGVQTISYNLYFHFEDIMLQGPAEPQSGWSAKRELPAKNGPLSSVLLKGSQAAGVMARIPTISSFAKTSEWALDIASSVAAIFGLSKPINLEVVSKIQKSMGQYLYNVDGAINALPISLSVKYDLQALPGFAGNDVDELSFDYLKTIPSFIGSNTAGDVGTGTIMSWTSANAVGTFIGSIPVGPLADVVVLADGASTFQTYNYGPIGLMGKLFQNWRGSLTYTFKFVKTEFHSGRLMINYTPVDFRNSNVYNTFANQVYILKEIVDIRECNQVTITVPFICNRNYLDTLNYTGYLTLYVLDVLQAPSTVSANVSVICEISGGPDFEVFNPQFSNLIPLQPSAPQSGWEPGCDLATKVIGGAKVEVTDNHAIACVGEKLTSFRQMMKPCNIKLYWNVFAATATTIFPFVHSWALYSAGDPSKPFNRPDYIDIMSSGFVLERGSVIIHAIPNGSATYVQTNPLGSTDAQGTFQVSGGAAGVQPLKPFHYFDNMESGMAAYSCPAWGRTPSRAIAGASEQVPYLTAMQNYQPQYSLIIENTSGTNKNWAVGRSAGEDFSMGMFIGFGPFVLYPA